MYNPPLTSSGSRSPEKRRPLPKSVKLMIELMVRGKLDDPDGAPLSFLEAGRLAGLAPHRARQWLDRAEARAYLRSERRSFRESLCASNELHLQRLRESPNGMVGIKAISMLEELNSDDAQRTRREQVSPGLIIQIIDNPPRPSVTPPTIDVTPARELEPGDDRGF